MDMDIQDSTASELTGVHQSVCAFDISETASESFSGCLLERMLQTYVISINLQQDGSLEKRHGENEAQRLLKPYDDSHDTRQHAFFDSYGMTYL